MIYSMTSFQITKSKLRIMLLVFLAITASSQAVFPSPSLPQPINLPGGSKKLESLFSSAVRAGNTVYLSGQIGIDPTTKQLPASFDFQVMNCFTNLLAVLQQSGCGANHIVKTTVLLVDINSYDAMNRVYESFFANYAGIYRPARAAYAIKSLPLGALVEIEAVAALC